MERIGLTLDEYVDLKIKPAAGADRAFHEAAEMERRDMFPMSLTVASNHLRSRGYDCRPAMLEMLIKNGVVTPVQVDTWTQVDVVAAAEKAHADATRPLYACLHDIKAAISDASDARRTSSRRVRTSRSKRNWRP